MLSIDLFDSKYERRLHEGAVDDAEYARLKKLGEKIDYLKQARSKTTDPEMKRAIDGRIKEYHDERMEILSVRGMGEAEQPQHPPAKGLLKGKDLITPQQRVVGATPPKPGVMGAVKDVVGGIKRFVKGEPDQGPTYEQQTQPTGSPLAPTISPQMQSVIELIKAWDGELDYIDLPLADGTSVPVTRPAIFNALVALKNIQQNRPKKYLDYVNKNLADKDTFFRWLANVPRYGTPAKKKKNVQPGLELTPPPVQQPKDQQTAPSGPMVDPEFQKSAGVIKERQSQKKKSKEASIKDTQLARAIQQARARFPTAGSDLEAFAKDQMDVNTGQDTEIKTLEKDIDQLKKINQALSISVNNLNTQLTQPVPTTPATAPVTKPTAAATTAAAPVAKPVEPTVKPVEIPVPTGAEEPEIKEPSKEKAKAKTRKPKIKQLPAKDMGKAQEIPKFELPKDSETLQMPAPQGGFDFGQLAQGELEKLAGAETEKIIRQAKKSSKTKAEVEEHGGGIGPRQHWQSMMRNEGWSDKHNLTPYAVYIDGRQWKVFSSDEHARAVAEKVRANLKLQGRDQTVTIAPSEDYLQGKIKEEKQISSKEDFVRERDRLLRMITQETNPANKQILRSAIRQLESRAENEGWLTIQQRMVKEDNASGAAEQAILKRIMVAHTDLLKQFGPEKVMQAAEEVAYNVGDLGEIGSSDVSGWVNQVKQILGATA